MIKIYRAPTLAEIKRKWEIGDVITIKFSEADTGAEVITEGVVMGFRTKRTGRLYFEEYINISGDFLSLDELAGKYYYLNDLGVWESFRVNITEVDENYSLHTWKYECSR